MTQVRDLLKMKSIKGVLSIGPRATVSDAVKMLGEYNVGSLVVMDDGVPLGFISERDFLRYAHRTGLADIGEKSVEEVMNRDVIIAVPEDEVSYVSAIMTKNKIRHLPVLHKKEIVGLISIGDVVYSQILDQKFENRMLHDYIEGKYPG